MYAIQRGIWTLLPCLIYHIHPSDTHLVHSTTRTYIPCLATVKMTHVQHVGLERALNLLVLGEYRLD